MGRPERVGEVNANPTPEQAFGITLREIRAKRRVSQQWLADKSGYHRTYIGLLEHGEKSASLRTVFNLATSLQVKPSEILKAVEGIVERAERKRRKG